MFTRLCKKRRVAFTVLACLLLIVCLFIENRNQIKTILIYIMTYHNIDKGIFEKKQITWCDFPITHDLDQGGIPFDIQDITHPSVIYAKDTFAGHNIWAAVTPYPQSLPTKGEPYENTCIFYSDVVNGFFPNLFYPIKRNPIIYKEDANYNSDPDIFYDESKKVLYAVTRKRHGNGYKSLIVLQKSDNGQNWSEPISIIKTETESLCPCLVKTDSTFRIYLIEAETKGQRLTKSIEIWESKSLDKPSFIHKKSIKWNNRSNIWHGDIVKYNGIYYMTYCGTNSDYKTLLGKSDPSKYLWIAVSKDGYHFKEKPNPILKYNGVYRSSHLIYSDTLVCYFSVSSRYFNDKIRFPYGNRIGMISVPLGELIK